MDGFETFEGRRYCSVPWYVIVKSSLLHGMRLVCLQVQIRAEYWYIKFLLYLSHAGIEYTPKKP